jgi:hypothetical protein
MNRATAERAVTGAYKVDISRGQCIGTVSSEWFSRPDDQRFLSLTELREFVERRSERAVQQLVDVEAIRVNAETNDTETLTLSFKPDRNSGVRETQAVTVAPTHWSFGQLSSLARAPAAYLRELPAKLAAVDLQYGLASRRSENVKMFYSPEGDLMAATGANYGRIYDREVVEAVQKIAGDGVGETRWKIPGVLDWAADMYNPFVDPTKDTTTLYASDRDVFMFLVDDTQRTRSKSAICTTAVPISCFAASMFGIARSAEAHLVFLHSSCVRYARTGTSGVRRTSSRSPCGTRRTRQRASRRK